MNALERARFIVEDYEGYDPKDKLVVVAKAMLILLEESEHLRCQLLSRREDDLDTNEEVLLYDFGKFEEKMKELV